MKAKKSLGQHFLKSEPALENMVKSAKIKPGETVLEIGPGHGALSQKLLSAKAKVIAVEKDRNLIPILEEKFKSEIEDKKLKIIEGDILKFDLKNLGTPYKVVANIPYYITGKILRLFLESDNQPEQMTILTQKEVTDRIIARDGKESILSISVKIFGNPRFVKKIPRGSFAPMPKVDSTILNIEEISRKKLGSLDEKKFFKILHTGFGHKRKQLVSNLSGVYDKNYLIKCFKDLGIDPQVRAEDLPLKTWLLLCNKID